MSAARKIVSAVVSAAGRPFEIRDDERRVDAIVVLGAPLNQRGEVSLAGRERVYEAVALWRRQPHALLVFTGGPTRGGVESLPMASAAEELGAPSQRIRTETQSMTTAENAYFAAPLLRREGVQTIWVISQPFHLRRGRRLFRSLGFEAWGHALDTSVQYSHPELSWRWVSREYVAWVAHLLGITREREGPR